MEYIVKIFQTIVILIGFFSLFSIIDIVFSNVKQSREFSVFEMFKFIFSDIIPAYTRILHCNPDIIIFVTYQIQDNIIR